MTRRCWVLLLASGVLGFEENPFSLECLAELSAEKVSAGDNRAKMRPQKSRRKRVEKDLLNNLICCLTFFDGTVRPLNLHTNILPWTPEWQSEKDALWDQWKVILRLEASTVNYKELQLDCLVQSLCWMSICSGSFFFFNQGIFFTYLPKLVS